MHFTLPFLLDPTFPGSQLCAAGYEYFGSEPVSIAAWRSRSIGIYNLDRFTRDYLVY